MSSSSESQYSIESSSSASQEPEAHVDRTGALFLCSAVHRLRHALEDTPSETAAAAIQGTVERMLSAIGDLSCSLVARVNFYEASLRELNSMAEDLRALIGPSRLSTNNEEEITQFREDHPSESGSRLERPEQNLRIFQLGLENSQLLCEAEVKNECRICLEDFNAEDDVCFLQCAHLYHAPCICKWLQINATCPACRMVID